MILEGLVSTTDADGRLHLAAMGPLVDPAEARAGGLRRLVLRPFGTSQTAVNLERLPEGVFHLTDDVLLLARVVAGALGAPPAVQPARTVRGWVLADACRGYEFRVERGAGSGPRLSLEARVVAEHDLRPFLGFNRAAHAVVEAAILVTRLHLLDAKEVRNRFAALEPLVEKTGGPREREAFALLAERVSPATGGGAAPAAVVEVRTPGRLHLGMLSFGQPDVRPFGGVGVMVEQPGVHVRLHRASTVTAVGPEADRAVEFARAALAAWAPTGAGAAIEVCDLPRSHVGLGSGTQLALAVAAGVRELVRPTLAGGPGSERTFTATEAFDLAAAVGRGRRSGVGIHGFSGGGLIVEAGHPAALDAASGDGGTPAAAGPAGAPLVSRVVLPAAWRCVVIVNDLTTGLHGEPERTAFRRLAPVPRALTAELARIALMDLVPAALEADFAGFSRAVGSYGRLAGQPFATESAALPAAAAAERLLAALAAAGVPGAAQSSWGPAVMACCPSQAAAEELVRRLAVRGVTDRHTVTIAPFAAGGARLRVQA